MKTIARIALLVLLVFVFALPVLAQEGETPPVEDPAFGSLLLFAAGVYFAVEQFKPVLNGWAEKYDWSNDVHQFAVRLLAFASALVLIFSVPNDANVVAALGLTWQVPEWAAKVLTALALSGGATFLYALQRFFKLMPVPTIVTATVEEVKRE